MAGVVTLPVVSVLVYFGLEYSPTNSGIYNDPVYGIYDDALAVYASSDGDGVEVSGDGFYVSIHRGRSRELDEFEAGTATVTLHNFARTYDNLYAAGIYFGDIVPGKRIEIAVWGQTVFTGTIEDWDMDWGVDGSASATISAVDALGALGRKEFEAWTAIPSETSGVRLAAVLDRSEVSFPAAARDLDVGNSSLQGDSVTWGSNVLNYCQLVNRSELGRLFASRLGILTHRARYSLTGGTPTVSFNDTGSAVNFHGVKTATGADFLYNRVGIDREEGILQTVEDATSEDAYGIRSLSIPGLLLDTDGQALDMATYLLGLYKDPTTRISSILVNVHGLADTQRSAVAGLEIGDTVAVTWTPRSVGSAVSQDLVVEGIDHDVSLDEHVVTLQTSLAASVAVAMYDDPVYGIYDDALAVYGF